MDHTSTTPSRAKRPKQSKASREKIPASGPRDAEAPAPSATAAAADDDMDTSVAAAPAVVMPSGTAAATVEVGGTESIGDNAKLNKCKFVEEVVGPPISQQVSTITVQVQPSRFVSAGAVTLGDKDNDEHWRCPPHTPVFTNIMKTARPEDGVPRVMSHVKDGLDISGDWFRFVGITMEDGIMDVAAQKAHKRCAGKGRFTVAAKGTVTVNCSPTNLREAQFSYGDAFCISIYGDSGGGGFVKLSGGPTGGPNKLRSCEFGGRLESTKQRTFVYSKEGIRIGTFIKPLVGPTGGAQIALL